MPPLPVGKLPAESLQEPLARYALLGDRVVVGPRGGRERAVLDMGDRDLDAITDPITFATDEMVCHALHVDASDLVIRGARPWRFLAARDPRHEIIRPFRQS